MFKSPGDVAFVILNLPIYWYGIVLACAVLVSILCAAKSACYRGIDSNIILDNSPWLILFGFMGARFYYCLLNFDFYANNFLQVLDVRQGGLSIHGMIFFGILFLYLFAKKYNYSPLGVFDVFACALPIGQCIGRWGNFFNSEAFGLPTDSFLGVFIPYYKRPSEMVDFDHFHPTFLYESIADLIVFFVLFFILKKYNKNGLVFSLYLILYSVVRFFIEFIRVDSVLNIGIFSIAQIVSILLFIVGVSFLIFVIKRN